MASAAERAQRLEEIRAQIVADPDNAWATALGYEPLYAAHPDARIVIVGQAPGRRAQESNLAWNDASGITLRDWLGVDEPTFRTPSLFAILPMDFYYPGKAAQGDLPPRRSFAPTWHPQILEQMTNVRLTLMIGAYAQRYYLGPGSVTERVQAYRDYLPNVVPLVHPSPLTARWRAAHPWFAAGLVPDLRRAVRRALAS